MNSFQVHNILAYGVNYVSHHHSECIVEILQLCCDFLNVKNFLQFLTVLVTLNACGAEPSG